MSGPLARVDEAVAETAVAALGASRVRRVGRPTPRDWSVHLDYVAEGTHGATALIAKIPLWDEAPTLEEALAAGPQDDTRREHEALVSLHEAVGASGDAGLVAVEPVGFASGANAIVMVRLSSHSLSERLGGGIGRGDVVALFRRVGRAIRVLHDCFGPPRAGAVDMAPLRARVAALEHGPGVSRARRALQRELGESLAAVEGRTTARGALHGDLTQSNVLVSADERVGIIDPNRAEGDIHEDPAHLLADVTAGRGQVLSLGLRRPQRVVGEWAEALAGGHGGLDPGLLSVHWAISLAERWAVLSSRRGVTGRMVGTLGGKLIAPRLRSVLSVEQGAG